MRRSHLLGFIPLIKTATQRTKCEHGFTETSSTSMRTQAAHGPAQQEDRSARDKQQGGRTCKLSTNILHLIGKAFSHFPACAHSPSATGSTDLTEPL